MSSSHMKVAAGSIVSVLMLAVGCALPEQGTVGEDESVAFVGEYYARGVSEPKAHLVLEEDGRFWAEFAPYALYSADVIGKWAYAAGSGEIVLHAEVTTTRAKDRLEGRLGIRRVGEYLLLTPMRHMEDSDFSVLFAGDVFVQGPWSTRQRLVAEYRELGVNPVILDTNWNG